MPTPRTDLQVGAGDGLAGPVYDPDTECARLSKLDDRRLHLSSIRDVYLPKLGAEPLGAAGHHHPYKGGQALLAVALADCRHLIRIDRAAARAGARPPRKPVRRA